MKMPPRPKRPKKHGVSTWYDSIAQCAAVEKIPIAVLKAAKRAGCPNFRGSRVDSVGLTKWIADHSDDVKVSDGDTGSLRDQKLAQEVRKLKLRNDAREGKLIAKTVVVETHAKILGRVMPRVKQILENEYPAQVFGLSAPDIREKGKAAFDEIATVFNHAGHLWGQA